MPEISESQEVLVINGMITDQPGPHHVFVSKSTPYNTPSFEPVSGCIVTVRDESGHIEYFLENGDGQYTADLPAFFLATGKSYSLHVITDDGSYRSEYDTLLVCPPIDTLYFEVDKRGTSDPDVILGGLQFFSEVKGNDRASRNYRWLLEETWEYKTAYVADHFWSGTGPILQQPSEAVYTCWKTHPIEQLFSSSTRHLSENALRRNPLNYVSNETPRLKIQYSLMVKQQSLTNSAFEYWNKMESQSGESGGLYETQPSSAIGNLSSDNQPEEKVLGLFYATQEQSKRITVENNFDLIIPSFRCTLDTAFNMGDLGSDFPYYLISLSPMGSGFPYAFGDQYCFDCTRKGGVVEKPDYW
jgi:hypothetical protein